MTLVDAADLAVKLLTFAWIGYARRYFASDAKEPIGMNAVKLIFTTSCDKEPLGMTAVKLIFVIGLAINLWHFFVLPDTSNDIRVLGLMMTIASAIIYFLALQASKAAELPLAFSDSTGKFLVSQGIYRYVRHPIYLAYLFYWSSWCVSLEFAYLPVALLIVLLVLYIFSIRVEERELERKFGEEYKKYRKRTRLLIPFLL